MKFEEMEELKEYWFIKDTGYKGAFKYRKMNSILEASDGRQWKESFFSFNTIQKGSFEPCEWKPKVGEVYFAPCPIKNSDGLLSSWFKWHDDEKDKQIKRNLDICRTPEEADKVARERFGWT